MRLIDADRLDEEIRCLSLTIIGNPKQYTVVEECKSSFRRIINEQPTAYDIDKVAEQLEERENIQFSSFSKPLIAVEDAIEIVKGGAE